MLDIEQDDQQDNSASTQPEASTDTPPAPPRRRRAATRPAGPPTVTTTPEPTSETATDQEPAQSEAEPAVAKASARKTTAKKTAAKRAPRKTAASAASAEGAPARAPRKRAAKKAAAPPPEPVAETPPGDSVPTTDPGSEVARAVEALIAESQPVTLAPSEAALYAAVEGEQAGGEAATLVRPVAETVVAEENWLPGHQPAPIDEPVAAAEAAAEEGATAQKEEGEPEHEVVAPVDELPADEESAEEEPADQEHAEEQSAADEAPAGDEQPAAGEPTPEAEASGQVDESGGESDRPESDRAESDQAESDESESGESDDDADEPTRRRRRRRGGRRRRRGGGHADGGDSEPSADGAEPGAAADDATAVAPHGEAATSAPAPDDAAPGSEPADQAKPGESTDQDAEAEDGSDESAASESDGPRRRRRRRRRRGEDNSGSPDDPAEVVVRVREPGGRRKASDEPAGIEGSTRLEAKRQRRREGREAGRRRAPILSEAEFLARRESVKRTMVIRQREDSSTGSGAITQIGVLEDDILVEHYVDRDSAASLIGNVYLGRVQNVLPSMEAAFIDIGRGRNAVLYAGEVDWDSFGAEGQARKVEKVLKSGQTVLVQVTKDPVGAKGARLTNHISIPGRYIVYAPGGHLSGISRKLPDTERKRLKDILADLVPESASVIVRTAAEGATEDELVRDVNRLKAQWEDIERKVKAGQAPQLLYGEPDLTLRIVRDLFTEDFAELLVSGNNGQDDAYDAIEAYVAHVAPHLADRLKRWAPEDGSDIFAAHRIDEQIAKALERKVFLPSGGSLVIDRTEAMTVIDVNTGKFTGTGGNLEATVTSNNLEAAEEIVRQLRLRDLGGIIVIDFIDMVLPSNRELLLRRLVECLGRDRTRHQVAEVTSLGLVQMTRKRIGTGLLEAFSTECEHCHGRGYEIHDLPVESQKQADGGARDRDRGRPQRGGGSRRGGRGGSGNSSQQGSAGGRSEGNGSDHGAQHAGSEHAGDAPTPVS